MSRLGGCGKRACEGVAVGNTCLHLSWEQLREVSLGALVAAMVATSGDESFVMLLRRMLQECFFGLLPLCC